MAKNYYGQQNTATGVEDFFDADTGSYLGPQAFSSGGYTTKIAKPSSFASASNALASAVQGGSAMGAPEMVSLIGPGGQRVSVSKQDWTTNPAYKDGTWALEGGGTTTPNDGSSDINSFLRSLWGDQANNQVTAPNMGGERIRLESARTSRIQALDAQFAQDMADLQRQNKDTSGSLKARLIKMGISPSDSSWSNAEAGQIERDRQSEARLRNEYMSNKAKIESDVDSQLTSLAMNENKMKFDADVANINTMLEKSSQGISLYNIFSQRDQSEKDREQKAYGDLLQYQGTMASLDQKSKEARAKSIIENAQKGYYNISDKATLEMLIGLEKELPEYLSGLSGIASSGLTDRLTNLAKTKLETEKIGWDIKQTQAQINKLRSDAGGSSMDKETKAMYEEAAKQLGLLSTGKTTWETAFKTMKYKYNPKDSVIDDLMGGGIKDGKAYGWAEEGHYEKIQANRKGTEQVNIVIPN